MDLAHQEKQREEEYNIMEVLNMTPTFPIMGLFMALLGRFLLATGLYYMGKAMWLTLRGRR